jgi:DNA-binding SARP family transcriptional activator
VAGYRCGNLSADFNDTLTRRRMGPSAVVGTITRIQLCGQFAVIAEQRRVESELPGRRGRLLVAYLAAYRQQLMTRDQLIDALWPAGESGDASATLTVLLSKTRALPGHDTIRGRASLQLVLPPEALIDTEAALVGLHQAESAIALGQWRRAWGQVLSACFAASRPFLAEFEAPWIAVERDRFSLIRQRALACYIQACLGIGGTELPAAERAARTLVAEAPLAETGYRLLMQAQAANGDTAAALRTYHQLRKMLADELGVDPDPHTRALHQRLLTAGG